jgi:hypothetical protein
VRWCCGAVAAAGGGGGGWADGRRRARDCTASTARVGGEKRGEGIGAETQYQTFRYLAGNFISGWTLRESDVGAEAGAN